MAKNITITPAAEKWGRDHGMGELLDDLRKFVAAYQHSWRLTQKRRQTDKVVSAAQARIDKALAELKAAEEKLLEGINKR